MAEERHSGRGPRTRRRQNSLGRRRRVLIFVVAGSVVLTGAGVAAASFIKSPAQAAADTRPPPASVLTAAVQKKVHSETVITRGKVIASQQIDVSGEGAGDKDAGRSIVTKVSAKEGDSVRMGQLLLEVSGRPIFVLKGDIPAYRDLKPGSTGEDVAQLQQALAALGYASGGDQSGTFGAGTEGAVTRFYEAHDFTPQTEQAAPVLKPMEGTSTAEAEAGDTPVDTSSGTPHVIVPMSEITYVRAEPAYVEQVSAHVGDEARGDLVSISAGTLIVSGSVAADIKGLVRPGQKVSIASEATGTRATGKVESVADKPSKAQKDTELSGSDSYALKIKPSGRLSASMAGEDVRLTITAASSDRAVLAVPTSAVSAGEDGQTSVTVRQGEQERRVVVDTWMTADGYVQVIPEDPRDLVVGDRVIVGVDEQHPAGVS